MYKKIFLPLFIIFCAGLFTARGQDRSDSAQAFPAWQEGYLDIHHINTGRGNSAFLVLPDGTTLLIDAGDMDTKGFDRKYFPLRAAPAFPSDTISAAGAIAGYIRQAAPRGQHPVINYALITHFHGDHYGQISLNSPWSGDSAYQLSGMTALGDLLPIETMIDRGYPAYDFPTDLRTCYKAAPSSFLNYLAFVSRHVKAGTMKAAQLEAGRNDQLVLRYAPMRYPAFSIRNIKANNRVWTGNGNETRLLFSPEDMLDKRGAFNENPLSLAIKIGYGKFDYYTGGDNTGRDGDDLPGGRDTETPMGKVVGRVDAMSLDHHGNRDASNAGFLKALAPGVIVAQTWCSDQPGQEIAHRLLLPRPAGASSGLAISGPVTPPDVFFLFMHEETKVTLGPWITRAAKSMEGHVVIRVMPGGNEFYVFVLDDRSPVLRVKSRFGPYLSE